MKKLFLVTAVICLLLNGAIIRTWLNQEASAKEKFEKKDIPTKELALAGNRSK
jgi:hypothetical protein